MTRWSPHPLLPEPQPLGYKAEQTLVTNGASPRPHSWQGYPTSQTSRGSSPSAFPATCPSEASASIPVFFLTGSVYWGFCFGWKEEAGVFACLALSSFLIPPPFLLLASQDVSSASLAPLQPLPSPGRQQPYSPTWDTVGRGFPECTHNAFCPRGGSAGHVPQGRGTFPSSSSTV